MVGCFLYMKLIRDITCLVCGGALLYAIIQWRHFIFFPIVWPFARLNTSYRFNGPSHREFEARPWVLAISKPVGKGLYFLVVVWCIVVILIMVLFALWPVFKWLYHLYVVC